MPSKISKYFKDLSLKIRFKKIIKMCKLSDRCKVLDVGCRNMELKSYLPNNVEYVSVDIKPQPGVIKVDLNEQALPFNDKEFDYVFCLEVLEHIHSPYKVISELKRVSKKYIIISVPNPYHYRDIIKHLFRIPDKVGHINSFIYSNIWRICNQQGLNIKKIKGSFLFPFLPSNGRLWTRHMIYLLEINNQTPVFPIQEE